MTDKTNKFTDSKFCYETPEIRVVHINPQNVLCQSGNGPMYEKDYGNGGFHNS